MNFQKKLSILILFLGLASSSVYAGGGTRYYYARATATAIGPTGAGTVYAEGYQNGTQGTTSTAVGATTTQGGAYNNFRFTAYPNEGYDFKGWSTTNNVNATPVSEDNPYTGSYNASTNDGEGNATDNYIYAIFAAKPTFYFAATATASPAAGGTATATPATTSAYGDRWNSTSATATATFSASAAEGYEFVAWYSDAGLNTQVSTSTSYGATLTSTSTNSGNPDRTTLYAKFDKLPDPTSITPSVGNIELCNGNSTTFTYTLAPAKAYNKVTATSGNTGIATVSQDGNNVTVTGVAVGTTSITLSAARMDAASPLTATVDVTVRAICAAPTINYNNTTGKVTITPAAGTSVYYTTNGSTPTDASTPYSDAFSVGSSATTVKAVAYRDGYCPSEVVSYTVDQVATPTIEISSTGVTFSCSTTGAEFYYTTNGDTPTTSLTPWDGTPITGLADGAVIKVIAVVAGLNNSAVASSVYYTPSGVSGGIVTLNDLEDHRWTYYQSSGNLPTGYPTTYLSSPDPRNVKLTYMRGKVSGASEVAISAIEGDTMMVYYMTREKSVPGMTGDYPYTVISNPYSKRPRTTGSTGTDGFYGFAGWKVISGGEYIAEYGDGQTLPLDATIHFTNFDTYDTNAISADIVLQATWTPATVKTGNSAQTFTGGTYETNFWVLSGNNNIGDITATANATTSARYPDGTVSFTRNLTGSITAGGNNAKVEWVNMNSTGAVTAANYTFTMGRGIVNSANGGDLSCANDNANVNQTVKIESGTYNSLHNFTNGLNAGRTCDQLLIMGCDYDRAKNDNTKLIVRGGMYIGQDVQLNRAANSLYTRTYIKSGNFGSTVNVSGNSSYTGAGGTNTYYYSVANTHNTGRRYLCMEGGRIDGIAGGMDETNAQTSTVRAFDLRVRGNAQIDGVVYGAAEFANGKGIRTMVFTGGTVNGWVAGGANGTQNNNGALTGSSYIYMGGTAKVESDNHTQVMNRAVGGNVFGAGCGYSATSSSGQVTVETNVVLADEAYVERGVYGGGSYGYTTATSNLYILGGAVGGQPGGANGRNYNANITGGVFGGACQNQGGTVNIYMNGGLVEGGLYGGSNASGNIQNNVTMHIDGGQVGTSSNPANIHGGGYGSATRVLGSVNLALGKEDCSSVLGGVTVYGDVYGGSAEGRTNGDDSRNGSAVTNVTLYHGTINGGLYGGGLGSSSNPAIVYGPVAVKVYGGSVRTNDGSGENGSGGVFGCNNVNGTPQSTVNVDIYGTDPAPDANSFALFAVYGGGNRSHYTADVPIVTIHGCNNSIEYVYGGGNASNVPGTDVTIWGGHIGNAFGGGNGYSVADNHDDDSAPHYNPGANITASGANLTIHGGTIDAAFGGSNQWGYINGGITVAVAEQDESGSNPCTGAAYGSCSNLIVELYGGGNEAPAQGSDNSWISPSVTINSCDMKITNLFGGAKNANHGTDINLVVKKGQFENVFGGNNLGGTISGNVTLTLNGGTMVNAFGGNNQGGSITGTITVLVDSTDECPLKVDNVYGGGNQAAYTPTDATANTPLVTFVNGTVRNAVFGGGLGENAKITANPTVNIGGTGSQHAIVGGSKIDGTKGDGNVYGGGNQANVLKDGDNTGNTSVTLTGNAIVKGNVYGGGNQANVEGNTDVKLQ